MAKHANSIPAPAQQAPPSAHQLMQDACHSAAAALVALRRAQEAVSPSRVTETPSLFLRGSRPILGALAQSFIDMLDDLDGNPDDEPSLGSRESAWGPTTQLDWAEGADDGREGEHDGGEPSEDDEYTLGWSETFDQTVSDPPQDDGEYSLGVPEGVPHLRWADHQRHDIWIYGDAEEQCEDEGGACEDEGAQCDDEGDLYSDAPAPADDETLRRFIAGAL